MRPSVQPPSWATPNFKSMRTGVNKTKVVSMIGLNNQLFNRRFDGRFAALTFGTPDVPRQDKAAELRGSVASKDRKPGCLQRPSLKDHRWSVCRRSRKRPFGQEEPLKRKATGRQTWEAKPECIQYADRLDDSGHKRLPALAHQVLRRTEGIGLRPGFFRAPRWKHGQFRA